MPVTTDMLAIALGQAHPVPGSITEQQWILWVDDAEMLIEHRRTEFNAPAIDTMKLDYVVREAVTAHIKKPDDVTQVTVAVDDSSTSKSYRSGKGRVNILDEWWQLLGLTEPGGAFAADMINHATTVSPNAQWLTATDTVW